MNSHNNLKKNKIKNYIFEKIRKIMNFSRNHFFNFSKNERKRSYLSRTKWSERIDDKNCSLYISNEHFNRRKYRLLSGREIFQEIFAGIYLKKSILANLSLIIPSSYWLNSLNSEIIGNFGNFLIVLLTDKNNAHRRVLSA